MAQKTAVEWLVEQLSCVGIHVGYLLFEQAKQMEKEQMIDAFMTGEAHDICINAVQYYNETYGTTNSNEVTDQHLGKHQEPGS